jgi:hypothetical protein
MSNELDGMTDHLMGFIGDLLMMDLEPPSDFSCRWRGRRYPHEHLEAKHECIDPRRRHIADTPNDENSPQSTWTREERVN